MVSLLEQVIIRAKQQEVKEAILYQLRNIFDYQDNHQVFIESKNFVDGSGTPIANSAYLRVRKDLTSRYQDPATGTTVTVPGIIMSADKHIVRTEGVVVEALLGQGEALDDYSQGLQRAGVEAKEIENKRAQALLQKEDTARQIVEQGNAGKARIYEQVYPCCPAEGNSSILVKLRDETNGRSNEE
jgi:hypothetical protein